MNAGLTYDAAVKMAEDAYVDTELAAWNNYVDRAIALSNAYDYAIAAINSNPNFDGAGYIDNIANSDYLPITYKSQQDEVNNSHENETTIPSILSEYSIFIVSYWSDDGPTIGSIAFSKIISENSIHWESEINKKFNTGLHDYMGYNTTTIQKLELTQAEAKILSYVKEKENLESLTLVLFLARQDHVWGSWVPVIGNKDNCHRWILGMRDSIVSLGEKYWKNNEYEIQYADWSVDPSTGFEDHGVLIIRFKDEQGKFDVTKVGRLDNRGGAFLELPSWCNSEILFPNMPLSHRRTHPFKLWLGVFLGKYWSNDIR